MSTIVYDAGAWALHERALARSVQSVVPAPVLTDVSRGGARQHRLGLLIRSCDVDDFREPSARAAGVLLSAALHAVVDASVVECALRHASPCVTGNRSHLADLAGARRINIIDI